MSLETIAKQLAKLIKENDKKTPKAYDTQATVTRIEGSTAWVHIAGGVDETPVKRTISCQAGDNVQVRVSGGRAWITGNATAPPTDDRQANIATEKAEKADKKVGKAQEIADTAKKIAGDTNQYFWHTESGTDTGAHITEKPQEEFLADPQNGGGNLLARSNGIAVRDGLTELATFGAGLAQIGQDTEQHAIITSGMFSLVSEDGTELFRVSGSGTPKSQSATYSVKTDYTPSRSVVTDLSQTPTSGTTITVSTMGSATSGGVPVVFGDITFTAGTTATKTIYNIRGTTEFGTCTYDGDKRFTFTMTYSSQSVVWRSSVIIYNVVTITDAGALKVAGEHYMNISADTDLTNAISNLGWTSEVIVNA